MTLCVYAPPRHTICSPTSHLLGREAPGKAFRLYTERTFSELEPMTTPEIQRSNLGSVILQVRIFGEIQLLGLLLSAESLPCAVFLNSRSLKPWAFTTS